MEQDRDTMMNITEAAEVKFGKPPEYVVTKFGYRMPGGFFKTIASSPEKQPWFGYAMRTSERGRKYWPVRDVLRWAEVWSHNLAEYAEELLQDEREHVREGVRRQLLWLSRFGRRIPQSVRDVLSRHHDRVAVDQ